MIALPWSLLSSRAGPPNVMPSSSNPTTAAPMTLSTSVSFALAYRTLVASMTSLTTSRTASIFGWHARPYGSSELSLRSYSSMLHRSFTRAVRTSGVPISQAR